MLLYEKATLQGIGHLGGLNDTQATAAIGDAMNTMTMIVLESAAAAYGLL